MHRKSTFKQARALGEGYIQFASTEEGRAESWAHMKDLLHYVIRVGLLLGFGILLDWRLSSWFGWMSDSPDLAVALVPGALAMIAVFGAYYTSVQSETRAAARRFLEVMTPASSHAQHRIHETKPIGIFVDDVPTQYGWDSAFDFLKADARPRSTPWAALKAAAAVSDEFHESTEGNRLLYRMVQGEVGRAMVHIPMYRAIQLAVVASIVAIVPATRSGAMMFVLVIGLFWMGWQTLVIFTKRT